MHKTVILQWQQPAEGKVEMEFNPDLACDRMSVLETMDEFMKHGIPFTTELK